MAVILMALLVWAMLYGSSRRRREYTVTLAADDPTLEWSFNVRDMCAELVRRPSKVSVAYYELRRTPAGAWEMLLDPSLPIDTRRRLFFPTAGLPRGAAETGGERPRWTACGEPVVGAIEAMHRRYNGDAAR